MNWRKNKYKIVCMFKLVSSYEPKGDQPRAIEKLVKNLKAGKRHQVLLGVTGSGKTFTMAKVIEKIQRPALVISHNKTLAAQLYQEFKEYFPNNAVHYFVSYYSLQYERNDIDFRPGTFRVRGDTIEIYLVTGKQLKIELRDNTIASPAACRIFPAKFWATPQNKIDIALENIKLELQEQIRKLQKQGKLLEAQRLERKTNYDIDILKETGSCHGVENYSRHLEFRKPGQAPYTLLEYFKKNFLVFIDESHMTLPQIKAMATQDRARKETLIEYGFRLPSAIDNRPLTFGEFQKLVRQAVYVSATPADFEKQKAGDKNIVEQLIRPTGLLEPSIEIRPTKNQVKDLIIEIRKRIKENQRVLAITLTKKLAEALAEYFEEAGLKAQWLHAEIKTTLIQTMGRAARHPKGHVIMYADKMTGSMKASMDEIDRRREIKEPQR